MEHHFYQRDLLGIKIYDTTKKEIVGILDDRIKTGKKTTIFGVSAGAYGRLKFRPDLYGIYKQMDILIAEGAGIPLLAKFFGIKITEKIGLVNLTNSLLELANKNSYKIMFFGATAGVNNSVSDKIKETFPNIKVCDGVDGYFNENEIPDIIQKINECNPDILFIGITYPIKERFTIKYKDELNTKLIVPCGGAFDIIAGKTKRLKEISKFLPIAWLIRFIQEPIRLFKPVLITVIYSVFWVFPRLLIKHHSGAKNPSIANFFNIDERAWDPTTDPIKNHCEH
ncbi:MAG TPA: WecB/TagA/CpsF family glycosyltransferase [Bacteroidales bacterium]|nr:WecB/TagA/CpsF family glycosyltransferase [Bacteroidales bacterium]